MPAYDSTRLRDHIHEVRQLFFLDVLEASFERGPEICRVADRSLAVDAKGLRHLGKIHRGIVNVGPNTCIFNRTTAELRDFDPMFLRVLVGLVVMHDHEERNTMFGRGPERARSHQHVAVGLNADGELTRTFQC